MISRCCLCLCIYVCVSLYHSIVVRQRLGKNHLIVARQRLGKNSPIVAGQRLGNEYIRNNRRIFRRVVFNVGRVVSMKVGD
jgi:hypothetical protein